jgi:hypothetical protein
LQVGTPWVENIVIFRYPAFLLNWLVSIILPIYGPWSWST